MYWKEILQVYEDMGVEDIIQCVVKPLASAMGI